MLDQKRNSMHMRHVNYLLHILICFKNYTPRINPYKSFFRVRIKWNLFRTSTSIVSMAFTEDDEDEKSSKLMSFFDKNQINIQIIKIYAGVISVVLEGSYS